MVAVIPKEAPPNGGASCTDPKGPWQRVSEMQDKLHRWAAADSGRRFDDVFNLVHGPATLRVAFDRVAGNRGRNTPGIDGVTTDDVEHGFGVDGFLDHLRLSLKDGSFRPVPVRQRQIPKPGGSGKLRKLGIPTIADRVVQAALKRVLEPVFRGRLSVGLLWVPASSGSSRAHWASVRSARAVTTRVVTRSPVFS
ncbi:hypothetical protein [Nocardia sp. NPDC059691]|uniref:hypothetical protein n=1 Tax=Nocardia sp. NPDC059691 TaxID=3346908 RepID=UPI00368006B7